MPCVKVALTYVPTPFRLPNSLLFGKECMAMAVKPVALALRRWRIHFTARNRGPTHNTNHNKTQFIPNCLHHLPQTNSWATPHPPHPAFLAPKFAPSSCVLACFLPPIVTCTAPASTHKLPHTWHRPPDTPVSPAHHHNESIHSNSVLGAQIYPSRSSGHKCRRFRNWK